MDSTITWSAGSTVNYTIAGSATHGGGSCQLSMSYDLGKSWNVIFSQIGGCLIDGMTTSVVIPPEAPSGEALLSWSWFNLLGNREMCRSVQIRTTLPSRDRRITKAVLMNASGTDQNCAVITITDGFSGLTGPAPFVANAGVNNCHTIENIAVVFEHPGNNVVYGGAYASTKPTTPAGFTGSNCVGPEAAGLDTSTVSISSSQISSQSSTASSQSASGTLVAIVHASTAPSATSITSSEATLSRTRPVGA